MAIEAKRGCGYRKIGGLYLIGGGLAAPCDRMPYPLERCRTCGGGIKFTRGPQWLQPEFFDVHRMCVDTNPCPVCRTHIESEDQAPMLLLWIGRKHYTPESFLKEGREFGVSRRLSALPEGLVLGETWVLLAHLDAVPPPPNAPCVHCGHVPKSPSSGEPIHGQHGPFCEYEAPKPTPGIFCAFIPRAVELILKQADATPERIEKEKKRGVTVVAVPDDDTDHQGSVWDKEDEDDSQLELPGVVHG